MLSASPVCSRRGALKMITFGGLAGVAGLAAACTTGSSGGSPTASAPPGTVASPTLTTVPSPPTVTPRLGAVPAAPARVLDVTDFGAVGDGSTDDTAAITRALAALATGDALRFPSGRTFVHSTVLSVATPGVGLLGPGTLLASAEATSALKIEADDVSVDGLTLAIGSTTQRWSTPDQHKLYLNAVGGAFIRNVKITGSAAAGLFCDGIHGFRLTGVMVSNTRADGIHMTRGSHDGLVTRPTIDASGDDGVAVVSYLEDGDPCHDIVITRPLVKSTTGGRGISVVGGTRVHYSDIDVSSTSAAGVYIACEGGDFVTASTTDVVVERGSVRGANTDTAIDHGAVLVYSGRSGGSVSNVFVSDLDVSGTRTSASRQIGAVSDGSDDTVNDIVFRDLKLAAEPQPYQGDAVSTAIALVDVTASGQAVQVSS